MEDNIELPSDITEEEILEMINKIDSAPSPRKMEEHYRSSLKEAGLIDEYNVSEDDLNCDLTSSGETNNTPNKRICDPYLDRRREEAFRSPIVNNYLSSDSEEISIPNNDMWLFMKDIQSTVGDNSRVVSGLSEDLNKFIKDYNSHKYLHSSSLADTLDLTEGLQRRMNRLEIKQMEMTQILLSIHESIKRMETFGVNYKMNAKDIRPVEDSRHDNIEEVDENEFSRYFGFA